MPSEWVLAQIQWLGPYGPNKSPITGPIKKRINVTNDPT